MDFSHESILPEARIGNCGQKMLRPQTIGGIGEVSAPQLFRGDAICSSKWRVRSRPKKAQLARKPAGVAKIPPVLETLEWRIKPRQIYDAQKMQTVERTRVWVREVIRKNEHKNIRMGTQNKIIIPIFDMIDETNIWSWAEVSGETGESQ